MPQKNVTAFKVHRNVEEKKRVVKASDDDEKQSDSSDREDDGEETTTDSLISQNFHPAIEEFLNKQINLERQAWYTYLSMVCHGIQTWYMRALLLFNF